MLSIANSRRRRMLSQRREFQQFKTQRLQHLDFVTSSAPHPTPLFDEFEVLPRCDDGQACTVGTGRRGMSITRARSCAFEKTATGLLHCIAPVDGDVVPLLTFFSLRMLKVTRGCLSLNLQVVASAQRQPMFNRLQQNTNRETHTHT